MTSAGGPADTAARAEAELRERVEAVLPVRVTSEPGNALHSAFDAGWQALAAEVREVLGTTSRPTPADGLREAQARALDDTAARVEALAARWETDAENYRKAEPVHFRGLAEECLIHADQLRRLLGVSSRPTPADDEWTPLEALVEPVVNSHRYLGLTDDDGFCLCGENLGERGAASFRGHFTRHLAAALERPYRVAATDDETPRGGSDA